ncbi:MAG: lamin tail domain-containing protein [Flavobacteriales bacterium]|nr:lamin tail domain-containing protein [Flavobacteriales bacterium]
MNIFYYMFLSLATIWSGDQDSASMAFAKSNGAATVVINEVDTDNPGLDNLEFVELYGDPNTPLDGLTLVFFNGADVLSYLSIDLDGLMTDENGFALIGNPGVPGVDLTFANGALQSGPDAVALVEGDSSDYPNDTPINVDVVVDAIVYLTDDVPEPALLVLLEAGQVEVNESALGNSALHSMSRLPDGGAPRITETYVVQLPTPGYTNVLQCEGGVLSVDGDDEAVITVCADEVNQIVQFEAQNAVDGDNYALVVCDVNDIIVNVEYEMEVDFYGAAFGECLVYGLSYSGELNTATLQAGENLADISGTECTSISLNSITVIKENCGAPTCDAGMVQLQGGGQTGAVCTNGSATALFFEQITDEEFVYMQYIITTPEGVILATFDDEEYVFFDAPEGICYVYGFAYLGELVDETFAAGQLLANIEATECYDLTENYVQIQKLECPETGSCSDLFFSEYIEGSSNNKALEIYNPTPFPIDLGPYVVSTYNNGNGTPNNQLNLSGILEPGDVYVICHSESAPAILNQADQTAAVSWFNGNDAIVLYNGNELIDIMGVIGENPAIAFDVNGVPEAMAEHTLVRNILVTQGVDSWTEGTLQWDVHPLNTFTFLGSHTTVPCNFSESTTITFIQETVYILEGNTLNIPVEISFPVAAVDAEVTLAGGTATEGVDFQNDFPVSLNFPEGDLDDQQFSLVSFDDEEMEGQETIILQLTAITPEVEVLIAQLTIVILASDQNIPLYSIAEVHGEDDNAVADSLDVLCELRGIVHGYNLNPDGVQFTLIDETGGIGVYHGTSSFGYTVNEGDSIHVVGVIDQFNGLTQIIPDTILYMESGLALTEPIISSEHNEDTESILVELKCVELVDPAQWTNEEPGFNVEITAGSLSFTMRIDADVDLFGTEAPLGVFNVVGIGGQFDSSSPYDSGYQFLPRYADDMSDAVYAGFSVPDAIEAGVPFTVTDLTNNADTYAWDFGDGFTTDEAIPTHTYDEPGVYTISLSVYNEEISCSHLMELEVTILPNGVEESWAQAVNVFPNPGAGIYTLSGLQTTDVIRVIDMAGRVVYESGAAASQSVLDLSALSDGVYLLTVSNKERQAQMRLVKGQL